MAQNRIIVGTFACGNVFEDLRMGILLLSSLINTTALKIEEVLDDSLIEIGLMKDGQGAPDHNYSPTL